MNNGDREIIFARWMGEEMVNIVVLVLWRKLELVLRYPPIDLPAALGHRDSTYKFRNSSKDLKYLKRFYGYEKPPYLRRI